jgi:mycothiol synthase
VPTDPSALDLPDRSGEVTVAWADRFLRDAVRWTRRGHDLEAVLHAHGGGDGDPGDGTGPPPGAPDPAMVAALAEAVASLRLDPAHAGATVRLAADHPADRLDPLPEAVADAAGLPHRRDLLVLRRPLPVEADHPARAGAPPLEVRPFRPGSDDAAWIRVNNRSFADHPDQGRETVATLAARTAGEWFDPAGFLVADDDARPGELAGFCWTKVHPAHGHVPARGEIYVIGVDPSHRGEGLGPSFVLAGLDHLAGRGITDAILYVDATNAPARRLYDRLGFAVDHRHRVYEP